jgi:hypothetical protein
MMTIEELREKLKTLIAGFPDSGFDAVSDGVIGELDAYIPAAVSLGMAEGKKLIENLSKVLKSRKAGDSGDESVSLRLTALDFYTKKLQSGSTEDL